MASRRILNNAPISTHVLKWTGVFMLITAFLIGCGTTKKTQRDTGGDTTTAGDKTTVDEADVSDEFMAVLKSNRSRLADPYSTIDEEIPSVFLEQSTARDIGDPNQGYRIQILSTLNVAAADSMANDFRIWVEDNFGGYIPKAYVLFRQPHYKVHVGNFHFHDQAMKLHQLMKERYPDAWVVHDEVEPNLVPADSHSIRSNN